MPAHHRGQRADVDERRRVNVVAVWVRAAVADHVEAERALRVLDAAVCFALLNLDLPAFAPAEDHVRVALVLVPARDAVDGLFQDAHRFAHLRDAHQVAVVHVAHRADRDVELEAVVDAVWLRAPHVVGDAARAQHGPDGAQANRVLRLQNAHALRPRQHDFVLGNILVEAVDGARQTIVHQLAGDGPELGRRVLGHPAKAQVVAHHARARGHFEQVQHPLPLLDAVQHRREKGAHVRQELPEREVMVHNARELRHDDAQVLRTLRHLDVGHQLLDRQCVAKVVAHRAQVVQPVGKRHVHQPGVALADLFVVAVQIAHHRLQVHHLLAVEHDPHAEHPVRTGVLRAHVHHERL